MDSTLGPRRPGRAAAAALTVAAAAEARVVRSKAEAGPDHWVLAVPNGLRFQDVTRPAHLMAAAFRFRRRLQGPRLASASLPRRPVLSARSCLPA